MNPQFQIMLQQAIQAFQSGNFDRADSILKKILMVDRKNLPALHVLGLIKASQEKFSEATDLLTRAARINPNDPSIQYNLAKALADSGLDKESIPHHKKAVELAPNNPEAWLNYGKSSSNLGWHDAALFNYDMALKIEPNLINAVVNKGVTLHGLKRFDEAIACYDKVLSLRPDYHEAITNKGIALHELKRLDEAIACYDKVLSLRPDYHEAMTNKGVTLHGLKRFDEAIACYDKALSLRPDYHEAITNKGIALHELKRFDEAIACYDKALSLRPDYHEAMTHKGVTLHDLKRFDEAIACYDKALSLRPDYHEAMTNKGIALHELKRLDEAIACYDKALSLVPDYPEALWNKSLCLLLRGDFRNGLRLYENRWNSNESSNLYGKRIFNAPTWLGAESLLGKTILIYGEQGLGDFLQFCRYIDLVSKLGARVILEVPDTLAHLMRDLKGVSEMIIKGEELPDFDYQCPLLSLPLALDTGLLSIPNENNYLSASPKKVTEWGGKLGDKKKIRVGLAWSSMSHFKEDSKRSLMLHNFVKALPSEGFEYICLQKDLKDCDRDFFMAYKEIKFFGPELIDFSDTAALIECVDLVVSTCTSIPHLSAALGKKTWILLSNVPDWRWLLDREDSPWYASVRLYRQPSIGNWDAVLERVKFDLSGIRP